MLIWFLIQWVVRFKKNSFDVLKPNTGRLVSIVGIEDKQLAAEKKCFC